MKSDPRPALPTLNLPLTRGRFRSKVVDRSSPHSRHALIVFLSLVGIAYVSWSVAYPFVQDTMVSAVFAGVAMIILLPAISRLAYPSPQERPRYARAVRQ